jgi:Lon-like ATP-dependent protease
VVIGLAYNEYGGSILFIESTNSSFAPLDNANRGVG